MRRIAVAAAFGLAIAAGPTDAQYTMTRDGIDQAQVRALEVQIEQLVERVCGLEATIELLRQRGCAIEIRPAIAAGPGQAESDDHATPDPWCATIRESDPD